MPDPANRASSAARLSTARVLLLHALATVLIQSVWFAVSGMMAVLVRKRFGAGYWETVVVTAAFPTLLSVSIFWHALLVRLSLRRYLPVHWACAMAPLVLGAAAADLPQLIVCFVAAAAGAAGWSPVAGELLRRFYGDAVRNRAYAAIFAAAQLGVSAISFGIGGWLDWDDDAFRLYLPAAAVLYGIGVLIVLRLLPATGSDAEPASTPPGGRALSLGGMLRPVLHMRQALRDDRRFARYEAAFMTYGVGWMICNALLPVLATDRLGMEYAEFAGSTHVVFTICAVATTYPMGRLMDRLGPTRLCGLCFAWLSLYPVGLIVARSVPAVGAATVFYGTGMAGVSLAWMLGPVALAPTPERVGQYVAIHASLVGIRGIVFQMLGMALYRGTGSFTWPFVIAAAAFVWAAWQMRRLHAIMRTEIRGDRRAT